MVPHTAAKRIGSSEPNHFGAVLPAQVRPVRGVEAAMKLRLLLPTAVLVAAFSIPAAPATAACTHVDGLVPVYTCVDVDTATPSATLCVNGSCKEIGARER